MNSRKQRANAIRALAMDAVEKAQSGHPGAPMGMADMAEVLWHDLLSHNPNDPQWLNRDRVVLSNGHASMLLYAVLHLSGYDLSLQDLKNFRQLHSKTPGHPEVDETPGVETTTGPLGQGIANAVGMAWAEKHLAACFNRPSHSVIDHHTYVFLGDGCLMEGISHEVCSLAGTWQLGKLIALYDDNGISIDGPVKNWFSDQTAQRFRAYGWQVIEAIDGHDADAIRQAIDNAKQDDRPSLLMCRTQIGFGSPNKANTAGVHGAPLGGDEIRASRQQLQWHHEPFDIPDAIYQDWDCRELGQQRQAQWQQQWQAYQQAYPELAQQLQQRIKQDLPAAAQTAFTQLAEKYEKNCEPLATRQASQQVLDAIADSIPALIGGSADLTGSNNTRWQTATTWHPDQRTGRYIHYGVREFGMAAIMNGMTLYGGLIPFAGTFLTFADYSRNAIRMAALMKRRVIHVLSHDSIGLGEDGPTHQPIEHVASLRLIPNLDVWRPADQLETLAAWQAAIERKNGPSALILSRQKLQPVDGNRQLAEVAKGGYTLIKETTDLKVILLATGSEVSLAAQAMADVDHGGVRLVSMPCVERFEQQPDNYRQRILPTGIPVLAIEAGCSLIWYRYTTLGQIMGIDRFGLSAPADQAFADLQFTHHQAAHYLRDLLNGA